MSRDVMTPEQRLVAAMRLEKPDRVPVVPLICYFAATYAGISAHELWSDLDKYNRAMEKCYRELGPWDVTFVLRPFNPLIYALAVPMKWLLPGEELQAHETVQLKEEEIMSLEDYNLLIRDRGLLNQFRYFLYLVEMVTRVRPELSRRLFGRMPLWQAMINQGIEFRRDRRRWVNRGATMLYGMGLEAPFDTFSLTRSLPRFTIDLYRHEKEVFRATHNSIQSVINLARFFTLITGIKRFILMCHRSSNDFISPKIFKKHVLPALKMMTEGMARYGICSILHCDGNWDYNLEYMLELPRGKCIIQLDGSSNIFRAKEILKNHLCLFGDVPAIMLSMGSAAEVDAYCKKLINKVGKDGGFVMGAGCEIPANAKPENVKVMIDSVKKYGYY